MFNQNGAFKDYLANRQKTIDSEKSLELQTSNLFNDKTFYRAFVNDMLEARKEVIIYSPFITKFRTDFFKQTFERLRKRNIEIFIFTRPLEEYDSFIQPQIQCTLKRFEEQGVCVFYPGKYIHEKVAIIDREILWEGSLNILSQRASKEIMRRTQDDNSAMQVISYIGLDKLLAEGYKTIYERLCRNLVTSTKNSLKVKIYLILLGSIIAIFINLYGFKILLWVINSLLFLFR